MEAATLGKGKLFGPASFYKKALLIALPVMLQMLIQNMVSLIDNFMVSGLGDVKMSGVNISGQILFVFMVLLNTICTAGGIFMSQYYGAGDKRGMRQALSFKAVLAAAAIVLYLLVCMVFPRQVLSLMVVGNSQADAILDEAVKYMFLMGFNGIPMAISTICSSSLREIGRVRTPLFISVIATLVNTFFNWVLIYGNLGAPRLEVQGAAIATIIARLTEMTMFLIFIAVKRPPFSATPKELVSVDFPLFFRMLKKGSMVLGSEMLWVISETVTTALYNGRGGADVVSGMAASFAIANLFFVAFSGITTATGVILGSTLGSGELDKARQEKRWLMTAGVVFGFFMIFVGLLTVPLIPVVFGHLSASAQSITRRMIVLMSLFMPPWVYINVQLAVSRAGGDTAMGLWVDATTTLLMIIPGIFLVARYTTIGPVAMYGMVKAVDFVKITIAHFMLKRERWVRNLTDIVQPVKTTE